MTIVSHPYFWDEQAAHAKLEEIVWPNGPACSRCGATDRIGAVNGKGARAGLRFCCRCRKQFRATIGTMFQGSHVPLHKWFQACFLLGAAENGITAHQLHLRLEVTNRTALAIVHRVQEMLNNAESASPRVGAAANAWTETFGCRQSERRRRARYRTERINAAAIALNELPWVQFPKPPRRQFLGFVETARELGCHEDDGEFDRILRRLGQLQASKKPPAAIGSRVGFPGPSPLLMSYTRQPTSPLPLDPAFTEVTITGGEDALHFEPGS